MTHMIIGEVESIDMHVKSQGSVVDMEPSDLHEQVKLESLTPVVVRTTNDYNQLSNRPSINEHLLVGGENTLEEIGIARANNADIARLFS